MNDLGLDLQHVRTWFPHEKEAPYVLVRVSDAHAKGWADALGKAVRRCYVTFAIASGMCVAYDGGASITTTPSSYVMNID